MDIDIKGMDVLPRISILPHLTPHAFIQTWVTKQGSESTFGLQSSFPWIFYIFFPEVSVAYLFLTLIVRYL